MPEYLDPKEFARIEQTKAAMLAKPKAMADWVGGSIQELYGPEMKKIKKKYETTLEDVDQATPGDHPFKGMGPAVFQGMQRALRDPAMVGYDPDEILQGISREYVMQPSTASETYGDKWSRTFTGNVLPRAAEPRLLGAFRYKRAKEAAIIGAPEAKVVTPPGYEEWLKDQRKVETGQDEPYSLESHLAKTLNAGVSGAYVGAGIGALAGGGLPGAAAGALSFGLASAATEFATEPLKRLLHGSEWYKAKVASPNLWDKAKALAATEAMDLVPFIGAEKYISKATSALTAIDKATGLMRMPSAANIIEAAALRQWAQKTQTKLSTAAEDAIGRDEVFGTVEALQKEKSIAATGYAPGPEADWVAAQQNRYGAWAQATEEEVAQPRRGPFSGMEEMAELRRKTGLITEKVVEPFAREIDSALGIQKPLVPEVAPDVSLGSTGDWRTYLNRLEWEETTKGAGTPREQFVNLSQAGAEEVLSRSEKLGTPIADAVEQVAPGDKVNKLAEGLEVSQGLVAPSEPAAVVTAKRIVKAKKVAEKAKKKVEEARVKVSPVISAKAEGLSDLELELIGEARLGKVQKYQDVQDLLKSAGEIEVPSEMAEGGVQIVNKTGEVIAEEGVKPAGKVVLRKKADVPSLEELKAEKQELISWLKESGDKDMSQITAKQNRLADVNIRLGNNPGAVTDLQRAYSTAVKMGDEDRIAYIKARAESLGVTLKGLGLVGAGTFLASMGLFPSDEAHAGVVDKVIGRLGAMTLPYVKSSVEVGREMQPLMKAMDRLGLTAKSVPEGSTDMVSRMQGLGIGRFIEENFPTFSAVIRSRKPMALLPMRMQSTWALAKNAYAEGYSPLVEGYSRQAATTINTENAFTVFNNVVRKVPELTAEGAEATEAIVEAMAPVADKWQNVMINNALEMKKAISDRILEEARKNPKKFAKGNEADMLARTLKERPGLEESLSRLGPLANEAKEAVEPVYKELASKYSRTRISLAAEDTSDFKYYPWLKDMLSWEEKVAVSRVKLMMDNYKEAMKDIGQEVIEERPYMQHSFHPLWTEEAMRRRMGDLGVEASDALPFSKFFQRSKSSMQMVPDVVFNMARYVPDTERRLQTIPFWDAWRNHMLSPDVQGTDTLRYLWRTIKNNMEPIANTTGNEWANRYTAFEAIRLLGGNVGTGFKHLLKGTSTMAALGLKPTVGTLGASTGAAARSYARDSIDRGFLGKLGLKDISAEAKDIDQFLKPFIGLNRMNQIVQDLNLNPYNQKEVDRWLQKIALQGSLPTGFAETVDRSNTVLASLLMADKAGLTPQQAMYGIYSNILQNNFVGGVANASWMRNPLVRAAMMFQTTAYKILERRLLLAHRTGSAIKEAWNIPGTTTADKLQQLFGLKQQMEEGQRMFKAGVILDALKSDKDIFGTPLSQQFMKELFMMGLGVTAGGALGLDLQPHFLHLPFVKFTNADPTLGISPLLSAMTRTAGDWKKHTQEGEAPTDFVLGDFMNNWLGRTGYMPLAAQKIINLSNDDIPDIYKDSGLRYLFSVPAAKD